MLPVLYDDLQQDFQMATYPSRTYCLDLENNTISGKVDGIDAVKQAVYLILHTERFRHEIYSWNYGSELEKLIGVEAPLVYAEIQDSIMDALIQDDRVLSVDGFQFTRQKNNVQVSFSVKTNAGTFEVEQEVRV